MWFFIFFLYPDYFKAFARCYCYRLFFPLCEESDLKAIDIIDSFLDFDVCTELSFWFQIEKKLNPCGFTTLYIAAINAVNYHVKMNRAAGRIKS